MFDLLAVEVFTWSPHLETTCEICLTEAEAGGRVGFAFLDIENYDEYFGETVFARYIYKILRESRLAKVRVIERLLQSRGVTVIPAVNTASDDLPTIISRSELGVDSTTGLRELRIEGAALGLGVLSSLISHTGDLEPDLKSHRVLTDLLLSSAYQAFKLTSSILDEYRPNRILVFNGRFACSKGIVEAAKLSGVKILFHEVGGTQNRYYLSEHSIHSSNNARAMLQDAWERAGVNRKAVAEMFFSPKRGGVRLLEARHFNPQQQGISISDMGRRRIVYYASSIDEYAAVEDGYENCIFPSQREAVQWLVDWVKKKPDIELILRIHPRMTRMAYRELQWWMSHACNNVIILPAEHPCDSYALAKSADRVVCFHSSMGPEATFIGKVSILIGDASYRGLDCVHEPQTIEELDHMLQDDQLPPKPPGNCLPFGYNRMTRGIPFRYYQPTSFRQGAFFGEPVLTKPSIPVRSVAKCLSLAEALILGCRRSLAQLKH